MCIGPLRLRHGSPDQAGRSSSAGMDTRVAAGGTLIRRYALALTPAGAGIEATVTAAPVPPLSGGPGSHGSQAAHAFTIADGVGGTSSKPAEGRLSANLARCLSSSLVRSGPALLRSDKQRRAGV